MIGPRVYKMARQSDGIFILYSSVGIYLMGKYANLEAYGWSWAKGVGCRGVWGTHDEKEALRVAGLLGLTIGDRP